MSGVALAARVRSGQDDPVSDLYAVRTTGVVCRVGCASRAPRPENVEFFDDLGDALAAGYRPCRRCRPDGEHPQESFRAQLVHRALGYLRLGASVSDTAARLYVSERHLRRLVRQQTGLTPRELATA
jgi:AraC family transcriptional regulator of adaptative response/methylated-DNA-[protein]-cysteine methyltransferase